MLGDDTKFLTLDKFNETFNSKPYFTTYFGLIHAIKKKNGRFFDTPNLQSQVETQKCYEDDKDLCNALLLKVIVDSQFSPPVTQSQIVRYWMNENDLPKL